jgi:YidC/Oxa1 family membrane protein insertase
MARQQTNATASPINSQMQFMTKVFPVLFGVFSLRFASGLVVYWVTSNTWRIGQQHLVLNKIYDTANAKPVIRSSGDDDGDDIEVEPKPPPRGGKGAGSAGAKPSGGAAKKPTGNAPKPQVRRPGSPLPPRDAKRGNGTGTGAAAPATSGNRRKKRKR